LAQTTKQSQVQILLLLPGIWQFLISFAYADKLIML
jgi:hypothetical protein